MTCAADALANLAVDETSRKAVGDSKAIEKLVSILADAAHPDSDPKEKLSELSEYAAMCLRNLALEEANAAKMAEVRARSEERGERSAERGERSEATGEATKKGAYL